MLKFVFSIFSKNKSFLSVIILVLFILSQAKINSLKHENEILQIQNKQYKTLCRDLENKLQAQNILTEQALKREQEAIKNEKERKEILKKIKPTKPIDKDIMDDETRKKVIARLNRSL